MFQKLFSGIILKVDYPGFKRSPSFGLNIWGKSMLEWVSSVFWEEPYIFADSSGDEKNDIISIENLIKENPSNTDYTVILFSDTPLIQRSTIIEAVEFCQKTPCNYCKMTRGYVIKNNTDVDLKDVFRAKRHYFSSEEDYLTASNYITLALINDIQKQRILRRHMCNGVYFLDPTSTFIDDQVEIGEGVTIFPNNHLIGKTIIKANVTLKNGNVITDSLIDNDAVITSSNINGSFIGQKTTVGPFAYLRPESYIGEGCRIGDYVEVKKSRIGKGSKVSHLTYVGDCEIGTNCNIGCGVVFCNYDGHKKYKSYVGDNVFIGSNTNIVSPVVIEDNSTIAAGSTITENVIKDSLAIARARQINKPGWKRKTED